VIDATWVSPGAHVHSVSGADYDLGMVQRADVIAWTAPSASASDEARESAGITAAAADAMKASARSSGTAKGYRAAGWAIINQFLDKRVYLSDVIA